MGRSTWLFIGPVYLSVFSFAISTAPAWAGNNPFAVSPAGIAEQPCIDDDNDGVCEVDPYGEDDEIKEVDPDPLMIVIRIDGEWYRCLPDQRVCFRI